MSPHIVAVHRKSSHAFSKDCSQAIELVIGHGVAGDAHFGTTVKHRSRVAKDPTQPNLRQVHLMHAELLTELSTQGFLVSPGQMGENITTANLDLLALPEGTVLSLGPEAQVQVTGLRNPCAQIETFMPGLLAAVLGRASDGSLLRKAGVMAIVLRSGTVRPGDPLSVASLPATRVPLRPV